MYNLKDCSATLLPCGVPLDGTWDMRSVYWVMPQHYRFVAGQEAAKNFFAKDTNVSNSCLTVNAEYKHLLQQNEPQEEHVFDLPLHLIEHISRYMHLFDYWNFRCTSKIIQSTTPLPLWRTNNVFPLFLVFEDSGELCRLMDPCRDDSRSCIFRFSQDYFDILYSKDGWLLLSDCKSLKFFNPFTREKRNSRRTSGWSFPIGFSTNPTCSKCLTLRLCNPFEDKIIIEYLKSGDTTWSSCQFDNPNNPRFGLTSCSPVYHSGAFYWLDTKGHLGVYEMGDEDTSWRVYDSPFAKPRRFLSYYLVVCGQSLLSVFIGKRGKSVEVFSFQQSEKRWVVVPSLGDYTLFLKSNSPTSVKTSDPKMKNRIYLPLIQGNHIVYYSLETKKYYVNDNEASPNSFLFKKMPSRCCWI